MVDCMTHVYVDLEGEQHLVGRLWARTNRRGRETASFEYDAGWLQQDQRFSLEPQLLLTEGAFHAGDKSLFGSIGDSAPDRWGRILMRRAARRKADEEGRAAGETLSELDYLLAVNDETRQGALRFTLEEDGEFLAGASSVPVPPLVSLPKLLAATERFLDDDEDDEDLRLLLAPGSSLGGARPKASVKDRDGKFLIAKFPRKDDEFQMVLWEAVALQLASDAGINTSVWRIEKFAGKYVILLDRFDREDGIRIPFLSSMSMLSAKDGEEHSYLEIVDAIRQYGSRPKANMAELWRRIVFSILISNTDDHLRNHAFLYDGQQGWKLSPLYDVNPTPVETKPRILTTAIDLEDADANLDLALSVIDEFQLNKDEAHQIIRDVGMAVSQWREVATKLDVSIAEQNRIASAFEHEDLRRAVEEF